MSATRTAKNRSESKDTQQLSKKDTTPYYYRTYAYIALLSPVSIGFIAVCTVKGFLLGPMIWLAGVTVLALFTALLMRINSWCYQQCACIAIVPTARSGSALSCLMLLWVLRVYGKEKFTSIPGDVLGYAVIESLEYEKPGDGKISRTLMHLAAYIARNAGPIQKRVCGRFIKNNARHADPIAVGRFLRMLRLHPFKFNIPYTRVAQESVVRANRIQESNADSRSREEGPPVFQRDWMGVAEKRRHRERKKQKT